MRRTEGGTRLGGEKVVVADLQQRSTNGPQGTKQFGGELVVSNVAHWT